MDNSMKNLYLKPDSLEDSHKVIDDLSKKIEELEEKLNLDSNNSSKPPSSDKYKKQKKYNYHKKSDNPIGAQYGHKGITRQQSISIDDIIKCSIDEYCTCGGTIYIDNKYHTHQVTEIIDNNSKIIEFHLYKGRCTRCGEKIGRAHV